jgi:hypothetical protein
MLSIEEKLTNVQNKSYNYFLGLTIKVLKKIIFRAKD